MISASIGCCGTITRGPEEARALTQGRYCLLKSMGGVRGMAAQMLHLCFLAHEALAVSGLGPVCGQFMAQRRCLNASWHGRLLGREGHNYGDRRDSRDDHCAAVDGCGVGAPTHPDHCETYRVGVACPGGCTAGAATLPLLPAGDRWGGALTTPDTGSAWPGHCGVPGGRDRLDCSPVCHAQTRQRGGDPKATCRVRDDLPCRPRRTAL